MSLQTITVLIGFMFTKVCGASIKETFWEVSVDIGKIGL